ncbi:alpha-ketoglutarate-dependent dioxygenase alkb [Phtheirospermum japonicum]|uniref:Alpha-ketoglutarate-dependent dioxygenase alkb n=1 Tax=Phtheirospermum japonicum TaxID=374723 RepID=A0A830B6C6_9LAMI|nr:alpha-ketoglutarate-dependent dioxygenase alkb [Phtheirospermum japonicum]
MQLGLYSTTFVAQRLSSVFKVSLFGRMANRGMVSRPAGGIPKTPRNSVKLTNNGQEKTHLWKNSFDLEKDFPSLSASLSSKPSGKRRTRVDLGAPGQQKSKEVQNINQTQVEASASISHQNDFFKNRTPPPINPKLPETHRDRGESRRSLNLEKTRGNSEAVEKIDSVQIVTSASISQLYDTDLPANFGKRRTLHLKLHATYDSERGESKRGSTIDEPFDICFPGIKKFNHKRWVPKAQSAEENVQVLRPGMLLFKRYIPISEQVDIVNRCRELGCGPGGFYRPGYEDGAKLRLYMMCLGQDWNPQTRKYGKTRKHDNVTPPDIPDKFSSLVSRVINDSHTLIKRDDAEIVNAEDVLPAMSPDVCIVNYYTTTGRLGLHQDRDESRASLRKGLPVVSISIGDSAEFLYSDYRDVDDAESVLLESGDVLIFGGESRHVFHGVKTIIRDTAPRDLRKETGLRPGRLNLTFRKY